MVRREGKFIILITSDSPNWKDYFETKIIPYIQDYMILLNWSQRRNWGPSWQIRAFQHWGGDTNFNPMAIVYVRFTNIQTIRFYQAFQDQKHGYVEILEKKHRELFDLIKLRTKRI